MEFVQSDVYEAAAVLPAGGFDLVYTGIGALNWLPSVRREPSRRSGTSPAPT